MTTNPISDMTERLAAHEKLLQRIQIFKPKSIFGKDILDLAITILEGHAPDTTPEPDEIIDGVRQALPPARAIFTEEFYSAPIFPYAFLRDTMKFYDADPLTEDYWAMLELRESEKHNTNIMTIAWLSALLFLRKDQVYEVLQTYGIHCIPVTYRSPSHSDSGNKAQTSVQLQTLRENAILSENSDIEDPANRTNATEEKIEELSATVGKILDKLSTPSLPITARNNFGPPPGTAMPYQDQSRLNQSTVNPFQNNRAVHTEGLSSYSSIGVIPNLPIRRPDKTSSSNGSSLLRVYSHPSQQFSGMGDLEENLAVYHQSFMSKCRTLGLIETEAFDNLHVLFKPNSPASIFYHKHVQNKSKTLNEAFQMLYSRFLSNERRDRLINEWNNLSFKSFENKNGSDRHSALREMCTKASMIQLQLGSAYQDDQHLRDVLMNACKNEPWAHRLATMPTLRLLDVQESLARAITAEERLNSSTRSKSFSAALINNTNFNNWDSNRNTQTNERSGMPFRRYGRDTRANNQLSSWKNRRAPDGKNPIRNHMRMLCRKCDSDMHLLRNCDKLTATMKTRYAKQILCIESICSDSEECYSALDILQEYDDNRWVQIEELCSSPIESDQENQPNEANFTTLPESEENIAEYVMSKLADISFTHSILKGSEGSENSQHYQVLFNEKSCEESFEGICMDNGAQKSLAGMNAYKRYCSHTHSPLDLLPSNELFKLGDIIHKSVGTTTIRMPIDNEGNYLEYETDVVDVDVPILFGLDKMKELKWYINEVTNEFCSNEDPIMKIKLNFEKGHLYLKWPTSVILFTRKELQKIHRRFAHPSTNKLIDLIKKARPQEITSNTRKLLDEISAHCKSCQRMSPRPFVFQVTMPDSIVFNHEVFVDLTWIEPRPHPPALHVVDRGTHFSAAQFVSSESSESVWNAFMSCWVTVYVGFPNVLTHDQGTAFTSALFKNACVQFGLITKSTPTESHNSLGPGERYHAPLRKIYRKLKIDYPLLDNDTTLSVAIHGLNITANPEGLIPTLLVYGSIPKIPLGNISNLPPNQRERFSAMEAARKEMEVIVAEQRIRLATKPRSKMMDAFDISPNSKVLVYREKKKCWVGPYYLDSYDGYKTAFVNVNGEIQPFSIVSVKRFLEEIDESETELFVPTNDDEEINSSNPQHTSPKIGDCISVYWPHDDKFYKGKVSSFNNATQKYHVLYEDGDSEDLDFANEKWKFSENTESHSPATDVNNVYKNHFNEIFSYLKSKAVVQANSVNAVIVKNPLDPRFLESTRQEIQGLIDRGACKIVSRNEVPRDATVLRSRVIHSIKKDDLGREKYKTRLVIMGHTDPEKGLVVSEAPTILRSSVRIILALASTLDWFLWSRDVTQAFIQSMYPLHRLLYVHPPKRPNLMALIDSEENNLLEVLQPWYGLADSPTYWWNTFKHYHINDLGMKQSTLDPCLFFKKRDGKSEGIVGTLVDDTLGIGTLEFARKEEQMSAKFDSKPRNYEFPIKFNGSVIDKNDNIYMLSQKEYTGSLKPLNSSKFTSEEFAHLRGQLSYAATSSRPDIAFQSAQLAQIVSSKADAKQAKLLNAAIKQIQSNQRGLKFPKLDLESIYIRGYADASFANNTDLSSQLGIVVLLCDKYNKAAVIHYASWKCRRITRSVLAAEVYALSACYDYCYTIAHDLSTILSKNVHIHLFTDSKSIFDTITKLSTVSEKRLLIDISALRQAYSKGEIQNVGHIRSEFNIADPLTKRVNPSPLDVVLDTGEIDHPVNQWIVHNHEELM